MKKYISLLGSVAISLFSASVDAQQTLTWCAYYNWAPWIYPVTNDTFDGILIEQLALFQQQHNVRTKAIVIDNWKRCQVQVQRGQIDFILGANKTPEREKDLRYVTTPAFINQSNVSALTATSNKKVSVVNSLDQLRQYSVVTTRGNSYGKEVDGFLQTYGKDELLIVNSHEQAFKLILSKRIDYVWVADSSFDAMVQKLSANIPNLTMRSFKKVFTLSRHTPAYVVFSKEGKDFEKWDQLWRATLKSYHDSVKMEERIQYHNEKSVNFDLR